MGLDRAELSSVPCQSELCAATSPRSRFKMWPLGLLSLVTSEVTAQGECERCLFWESDVQRCKSDAFFVSNGDVYFSRLLCVK